MCDWKLQQGRKHRSEWQALICVFKKPLCLTLIQGAGVLLQALGPRQTAYLHRYPGREKPLPDWVFERQQAAAWSPGLGFVPVPNVLLCPFMSISWLFCGWGVGGSDTGAGIF